MDFTDDLPTDTEEERFRKHNRFLHSLKSDTLLIIDNFNATSTQDTFFVRCIKISLPDFVHDQKQIRWIMCLSTTGNGR